MKLLIQGFIIGIGKIIPGVSGAMFAMMFGVYEKALNIISNLKKELKRNIKFITLLGIGVTSAIIFGSGIIKTALSSFYIQTMFLFIGMMLAGIKPLFKNVKKTKFKTSNLICAIIVTFLLVLLSFVEVDKSSEVLLKTPITFFILMFSGFLDAFATVVPGICGTALLMILGYYDTIILSLSDILNINNIGNNLFVLIPFLMGMLIGIYIISKLINYLFSNHKIKTYYSIIGFAIMSIILLVLQVFERSYSFYEILISLLFLIIGYLIAYVLEKSNKTLYKQKK